MNDEQGQSGGPPLSQVWQLPLLLLSVALLGAGWYLAMPGDPPRDFAGELGQVSDLIRAEEFDKAMEALDAIEPELETLSDELRASYHVRRADAITLAQQRRGWNEPANHRKVVTHYNKAREFGRELSTRRLRWLAGSYLALGKVERAESLISEIPAENQAARWDLRREILEKALAGGGDPASHIRALERFRETEGLPREHEVWAVARQAELLIEHGDYADAEQLLFIYLQRFDFASKEGRGLGELMVLLGEVELALGDRAAAERWLLAAQQQLDPADPLNGRALTGLGEIRFSEDNITEALKHFSDAVAEYPRTRRHLRALVGKAESESRLNAFEESLKTYDQAVAEAVESGRPRRKVEPLAESLRFQHDWRFERGSYDLALRYLERLAELRGDDPSPRLLHKLAVTHERLAESILGKTEAPVEANAQGAGGPVVAPDEESGDGAMVAGPVDPASSAVEVAGAPAAELSARDRAMIVDHFEKAGHFYHRHARAIADGTDQAAYSMSLWRAADAYDRAGMSEKAITLFQEYQATLPEGEHDIRATYRLAQAFQARGQFGTAARLYEQLIEDNPKSPQAYDSYVPLARCYLAQGPKQWGRAEQELRAVVEGNPALRPTSPQYRAALVELGRLYYRRGEPGDYERAIERLSEAVQRYGDHPDLPEMRFQLADANRKSVAQLEKKLEGPISPSERAAIRAERAERLAAAQRGFGEVIEQYEQRDAESLDDLESLYLRNSYFYRADCAYDLGRYEGADGAIALYTAAADRYDDEPSVLVAHMQIVNSWCELGRYDKARAANERAKWRLSRIEDEAFEDPNLPMSREHWKRWLEWTSELALADNASTASP